MLSGAISILLPGVNVPQNNYYGRFVQLRNSATLLRWGDVDYRIDPSSHAEEGDIDAATVESKLIMMDTNMLRAQLNEHHPSAPLCTPLSIPQPP